MHTSQTLSELTSGPAIYALMGGHGPRKYVAYVGMAGKLRQRINQHLILHDSSVATGTSAAVLNPDYVTEVRWWEREEFTDRVHLEAAEIVALRILDPTLRSRGNPTGEALSMSEQDSWKNSMETLFRGEPTGAVLMPTLHDAMKKNSLLTEKVNALERKISENY